MKWIVSLAALLVATLALGQTFQTSLNVDNPNTAVQREFTKIVSYTGGYYAVGRVGSDILIQRYNAAGALQAETKWDNPQGDNDLVSDAKMDTAGNLYVVTEAVSNVGFTLWLTKFNAALAVQYERRIDRRFGARLSVTPGGFGLMIARDSADQTKFWIYAYGSNGNLIWSASQTGTARCTLIDLNNRFWIGGNDASNRPTLWVYAAVTGVPINTFTRLQANTSGCGHYALAVDSNGTVYAAGIGEGPVSRCLLLTRFTNAISYFVPTPAIVTEPNQIAIDASSLFLSTEGDSDGIYRVNKSLWGDNSAVTSIAAPAGEGYLGVVIEPSADRVYGMTNTHVRQFSKALVATSFQNLGASMKLVEMVRAPGGGGVLVGGQAVPLTPSVNARVQRVNQNGSLGATNTVGVSGEAIHTFRGAFVDPTGEAFGTGMQTDFVDALAKSFVHRVNRDGQLVWRTELPNFEPRAVTSDGTNVFVVGSTPTMSNSLFTVKRLNRATGAVIWSRDLTISGGGSGVGRSVAILNGEVVAAGSVGFTGVVFRLLASTGDTLWSTTKSMTAFNQVVTFDSAQVAVVSFEDGYYRFYTNGNETVHSLFGNPKISGRGNRLLATTVAGGTAILRLEDAVGNSITSRAAVTPFTFATGTLGANGFAWSFRNSSNQVRLERWVSDENTSVGTISEQPAAIVFGANDQVMTYASANWVDPEGGNTSRIAVRRYSSGIVLLQEQFINPPGPGLDAYDFTMLPGLQGQNWLFSSLERRGQGLVALYTRWRQEIAPVGVIDAYSVTKGQTLTVNAPGVLTNDSDANGQPLTAQIVTNPQAGTLTLNANGGFTFVAPATAQVVTFTYRAVDNTGRTSSPTTVTITVNN